MPDPTGFGTLDRTAFVSPSGRHLYVYGTLRGRPSGLPESEPAAIHQRFDVLTGTWIAFSPARNVRPHARVEPTTTGPATVACPLCPGGPEVPFSYDAAVFDNRFPAFVAEPPPVADDPRVAPSLGRCEVVLYTEKHEGSLATLEPLELARVIAVWRDRSSDLWADPRHRFVMAFENRGEGVGATLTHPHGQVYAFDRMPPFISGRVAAHHRHRLETGRCLGCDVVGEDDASERIVVANDSFVVAVPFAPRWPYEVHVRLRRHGAPRLRDLLPVEQADLAAALRQVVLRYDGLFGFELPYMMTVMEGPAEAPDWHLALEFLPPHRNARLTKVRASVETVAGLFINDTLPESTSRELASIDVEVREEAPALVAVAAEP